MGVGTIALVGRQNEASRRVWGNAALLLAGRPVADDSAQVLLSQLGYGDGPPEIMDHRATLLRTADRFQRVFSVRAPDAPNLVVLGAEVDPAAFGLGDGPVGHVAGTGLNLQQAFEACVGEGVEFASQVAMDDDRLSVLADDDALIGASAAWRELWARLEPYRRRDRREPTAWATAASLSDGEPVRAPADLCFRRPADARDLDPPWPLSTGTGAGVDPLDATLHGLLELVERDAVALWWRGGRSPCIVADGSGSAMLAHLRGGPTHRRSWLLDITSDVGIPVVVAASCNDDGFGLCCGFAARTTLAGAADAAVREMAQMELAHHLSDSKRRERGDAGLNDLDRQHIDRFTRIDVRKTRAFHPAPPPRAAHGAPPTDDRQVALGLVRQKLEALGLSPCVLNLTRAQIGVAAVRTLCPGLEVGMAAPPGPRLQAAASKSGFDPATAGPL